MNDFRLKVFVTAARHLSFTKAAEELFVSQPSITKHIKEMESQYGVQLFERTANRIRLTPAGQICLKHCEILLQNYAELAFDLQQINKTYSGTLRIAASTTIAQYILPPYLAQFSEQFPDIQLVLQNENSYDVEKALEHKSIDLGMVEGAHHLPYLEYQTFMQDELVAITHKQSSYAELEEIHCVELKKVPLILRENGSGTLEVFKRAIKRADFDFSDFNVAMQLGSTESIKRYLEQSNAMGVVSIQSIDRELREGHFKVVEIPELKMSRSFAFVQQRGSEHPLALLFKEFLKRVIS